MGCENECRIMVVDDEVEVRDILTILFSSDGHLNFDKLSKIPSMARRRLVEAR